MKSIFLNAKKQLNAFTLIELIVVLAIIAIFATSGTLMLTKRFSSARDSSRKQAVNQIITALDVNMATKSSFPIPESASEIYDVSGALVWYQGVFGPTVSDIVDEIDSAPQDPSTNEYYGYSISYDKKKYQLKAELENEDTIAYLNQAYAANNDNKIAYIDGNYNGYVLTYTGGKYYLYQLPSMFMKDEGLSAGSKIGSGTLPLVNPGSKLSNDVQVKVAQVTSIVKNNADETTKTNLTSYFNISNDLLEKIIQQEIKSKNINTNSTIPINGQCGLDDGQTLLTEPSNLCQKGQEKNLTDNGVWNNFTWECEGTGGGTKANCSATHGSATDCQELLDEGLLGAAGNYDIDPDGNGGNNPYQVYCTNNGLTIKEILHTDNSSQVTIYTKGNTNAGNYKIQYKNSSNTRNNMSNCSNISASSDLLSVGLICTLGTNLGNWASVDIKILNTSDNGEIFYQTGFLNCTNKSASSTSTPTIDENCNGQWNDVSYSGILSTRTDTTATRLIRHPTQGKYVQMRIYPNTTATTQFCFEEHGSQSKGATWTTQSTTYTSSMHAGWNGSSWVTSRAGGNVFKSVTCYGSANYY